MVQQGPVARQQPRSGLLGLDQQQLVKRILVGERDDERRRGGFGVEWKSL